jgi:hypothetical protein
MSYRAPQGWIYTRFLALPVVAAIFLLTIVTCSVAAVVFSGRPSTGLPSLAGKWPHASGLAAVDRWVCGCGSAELPSAHPSG